MRVIGAAFLKSEAYLSAKEDTLVKKSLFPEAIDGVCGQFASSFAN